MGTYAVLDDIKIIMRASARERIRFSADALRIIEVGHIEGTAIGSSYGQSKYPEPIYTLGINRAGITIADSYKGRDLVNFVFINATQFNVYYQEFKDNSYDKRELYHGTGSISSPYVYNDITFETTFWTGTANANDSIKIQFEADISNEDVEFFIKNAEIAIDNMLSAASVDYLLPGEQRLFLAPDIPPQITMATQYLSAYYIYTNVYAEQSKDPSSGHFTERWKKMCMDVLRDFAIHKNRLPPHVSSRVNFHTNWSERVKAYFDTPILCCEDTTVGYSPDNEVCCGDENK